jgi:hypothetical protein
MKGFIGVQAFSENVPEPLHPETGPQAYLQISRCALFVWGRMPRKTTFAPGTNAQAGESGGADRVERPKLWKPHEAGVPARRAKGIEIEWRNCAYRGTKLNQADASIFSR